MILKAIRNLVFLTGTCALFSCTGCSELTKVVFVNRFSFPVDVIIDQGHHHLPANGYLIDQEFIEAGFYSFVEDSKGKVIKQFTFTHDDVERNTFDRVYVFEASP